MLTTLLKPATGKVTVVGIDAAAHPMQVRRVIGYVPQMLSADANLTGLENVELFARLFDVPRKNRWPTRSTRWASPRRRHGWPGPTQAA